MGFSLLSLALMTVLLLFAACSSPSGSDQKPVASITNLKTTKTGMTEVALEWDSVTEAESYRILKEGTTAPIGNTPSTSFTITGLNRDTRYTFVVNAINVEGSVIATGKIIVTTALLSAPENITVSCDSINNSVVISWDGISTYNKNYQIFRSDTLDGDYELIGEAFYYSDSFTDYDIPNGSTHYYKVAVLNDDDTILAMSDPVRARMGSETTPGNLDVVMTPTRAILTWNAVEGAESYIVEVYKKGSNMFSSDTLESTIDVSADTTTYTVMDLIPSTDMIFKVYSMTPTKSIPAEVTGKTEKLEVSAITQSACTDSSISFAWTTTTSDPVADGIVFDVYRRSDWSYTDKGTLIAADQTGTAYVDTWSELKIATCYYYSVVPRIIGSTTAYTGVTNEELHTTPFNAPANVTVEPGRTSLSVSWDDVPEAAIDATSDNHYKVSYAPQGSSSFTSVTSKTTNRVITGLSSSTTYEVKVCVANSGTPRVAGRDSEIVQSTTKAHLAAVSDFTLAEEAATAADKTNITVTWTPVPEAGSYKVCYRVFSGGDYRTSSAVPAPETSATLSLNAGNRYIIYVMAVAADDTNTTSKSGEKSIQSVKIVPETVILSSPTAVVNTSTSELMDLNDPDTWNSGVIPHSTDNGYSIGILKLATSWTTTESYYFKMAMTPAMLAGAPAFIMIDSSSLYLMDTDGDGVDNFFGSDSTIYAVSPNNLSTRTQIPCPTVSSYTSPKYAGTPITSSMVYNNTLYLRLDTKKSHSASDGSVGLSAYY
jgi:hypothetical protein